MQQKIEFFEVKDKISMFFKHIFKERRKTLRAHEV